MLTWDVEVGTHVIRAGICLSVYSPPPRPGASRGGLAWQVTLSLLKDRTRGWKGSQPRD